MLAIESFYGDIDIHSTGQILNLAFDRTPETIFHEALMAVTGTWEGIEVLNYAATESTHLEGIGDRSPGIWARKTVASRCMWCPYHGINIYASC